MPLPAAFSIPARNWRRFELLLVQKKSPFLLFLKLPDPHIPTAPHLSLKIPCLPIAFLQLG